MAKGSKGFSSRARGETAQPGPLENPLDMIAEDHMREREVCALIDRLVIASPIKDAERRMMLAFLKVQLSQHLADEEIDLFPLMVKRCDPEEEIIKVITKLKSDHVHALADGPAIAALIEANDPKAAFSETACAEMTAFANHSRRHLILENAIILPLARAYLTKKDLKTMRAHMQKRRGLDRGGDPKTC